MTPRTETKLTRIIIKLSSTEEAKDLARNNHLEYFKQNLVYSYLTPEQLEDEIKESGEKNPDTLKCPKTGLLGLIDNSF